MKPYFSCKKVPPERGLSSPWLKKATGVADAKIAGIHLRLPGCGDNGPTLEIFQYGTTPAAPGIQPDTPGFSHIAFAVEDVEKTADAVFKAGGRPAGELTTREITNIGLLTMWYVTDPEGNIVELQNIKP